MSDQSVHFKYQIGRLAFLKSHFIDCFVWEVEVTQSCLTLCNMCPGTIKSMARILQARIRSPGSFYKILSPGHLPNPGTEPRSSTLQADSLPAKPPEKPFVWESAWKFCSLGVNPLSESTSNPVSSGNVALSVLSSQPASEWG